MPRSERDPVSDCFPGKLDSQVLNLVQRHEAWGPGQGKVPRTREVGSLG